MILNPLSSPNLNCPVWFNVKPEVGDVSSSCKRIVATPKPSEIILNAGSPLLYPNTNLSSLGEVKSFSLIVKAEPEGNCISVEPDMFNEPVIWVSPSMLVSSAMILV